MPDGFSFIFKNRDVPSPYEPVGVFLIDQWRKIGLNVTQQVLETTSYFNDIRAGNFDVMIDFLADFMDEPDLQLAKFLSADRSPRTTRSTPTARSTTCSTSSRARPTRRSGSSSSGSSRSGRSTSRRTS